MKKLLLATILLLTTSQIFALEIVYPKSKTTTISAKSTFFIGNSDPHKILKINNKEINIHPSGNFAHVVNLNDGKNIFVIETNDEKNIYEINKPISPQIVQTSTNYFIEYTKIKTGIVNSNNSPLRETPQDFGINRITHLSKDTNLTLIGENNVFYKVKLSNEEIGWIYKSQIDISENISNPAKILNYTNSETSDFNIYEFYLDKKIPFKITEKPFSLTFYDIQNKDGYFKFEPFLLQKLYGYSGEFENNKFVLKIRKFPYIDNNKPLKDIKIAIDAGHGGREFGAIGCSGIREKNINLDISKKLKDELENRGTKVIMTRENDNYTGLNDRVNKANKENAEILLSIHSNALPDGQDPNKNSGTSIYYYYNQAKPLADSILSSIVYSANSNNDKVRQRSLALVRNTNALSILIEIGYLINPDDNCKLEDKTFQQNVVNGIADGIEEYLKAP